MRKLKDIEAILEETITQAEEDLSKRFEPNIVPIVKDTNGRYILLDAYVSLAQIKIALNRGE